VPLARGLKPHPKAVLFDLDRCLIDSRRAWQYCVEESLASAGGQRFDAAALVDEYHVRPWRHALAVLAPTPELVTRCEELCETMYERSAMKKLLVHEGVGMALDAVRAEHIEIAAISRLPHALAVKQVQSTGLDRFVAVLSATAKEERWDPLLRMEPCLRFLECEAEQVAFVGADERDVERLVSTGAAPFLAAWTRGDNETTQFPAIASPGDVVGALLAAWRGRPSS